MTGLSAYERQRQENIERNREVLRQLGIAEPPKPSPPPSTRTPVHRGTTTYLQYSGLMKLPKYETLRRKFVELLPFCAWRHLSETPSCLPVPCCNDTNVLNHSYVQFYKLATRADDDAVVHERIPFKEYLNIGDDTKLAGFVVFTGNTKRDATSNVTGEVDGTLIGKITHIVYSGAITSEIHADILLDEIDEYAPHITDVWLHYDMYLFEALLHAGRSSVPRMRFNCAGQQQGDPLFLLQTTVRQEVENMRAMHRQLSSALEMPVPKRVVDQHLGGAENLEPHAQTVREEAARARIAFETPQYVRPIVKRSSQDPTKLAVYYVNLNPISHTEPDVRIASPSARFADWKAMDSAQSQHAMNDYVYTPLAFDGAIGTSWKEGSAPSDAERLLVNDKLAAALRSPPTEFTTADLKGFELPLPLKLTDVIKIPDEGRYFRPVRSSTGRASLFNGDVILARLPDHPPPDHPPPDHPPVQWVRFDDPQVTRPAPTNLQQRTVKLVDETALSHKVIRAYAKRLADMQPATAQVQCQLESRCSTEASDERWSTQDRIEDILWKQRVGAIDDRPARYPDTATNYIIGVPNTFRFYRVLWYLWEDTIYLLPFFNYLMLRDHMGSCVPLHSDDGANPQKIIKFEKAQNAPLFDVFKGVMSSNTAREAAMDDIRRVKSPPGNEEGSKCSDLRPGYFSEYDATVGKGLRESEACEDAIYICEKHIRGLFVLQMKRCLAEHNVAHKTVEAFTSKFDEDACWPAIDGYQKTTYARIECDVWPLPVDEQTLPDSAYMAFHHDDDPTQNPNLPEPYKLARIPLLTNLSKTDIDNFRTMISSVGDVPPNDQDPLRMQVTANGDLYIAFSPAHTTTSTTSNAKPISRTCLSVESKSVEGMLTRVAPQMGSHRYTWPFNYYANGSLFVNNTSSISTFRQNPSFTTLEEAIPNLRIIRCMSKKMDSPNANLRSFEAMKGCIDDMMETKLAFNIGRNDKRNTAFALEVYDAEKTLRSAALIANLADPVSHPDIRSMSINALELVALFDNDAGASGTPDDALVFEMDDALARLGCDTCIECGNVDALKRVIETMCGIRGVACIIKTDIEGNDLSSGLKFWGPLYLSNPSPGASASSDVDVLTARNTTETRRHVLGLHTPRTVQGRDMRYHNDMRYQMYHTDKHGAVPNCPTKTQYCLFATPRWVAPTVRGSTIVVDVPAKKIGTGVYRVEGMTLRDGVCDLRFQSGDLLTVERAPSFASPGDTSIDAVATPRLDARVVDHGPPAMRSATGKGSVRTANLVTHVDRRRMCRVRFRDTDAVFEYLRESPTHLVVLTADGARNTSTVELLLNAGAPVDDLCMQAVAHCLSGGVFPAQTPGDRRILFAANDGEVCGVVLLHIGVGGNVNGADRLRCVMEHPGSYLCSQGPAIAYGVDTAPRIPFEDALAGLVYHNCIVGDAWVLAAVTDEPATLQATPVHTAVDGRCWTGTDTAAWNARMIRLNDDGATSWNSGFTPHLIQGPIVGDDAVVYHGIPNAFELLTPPTVLRTDLQYANGTTTGSTKLHTRATIDAPFPLHAETERLSVFVTPACNATLFIYVLLSSSTRSDLLLGHDVEMAVQNEATGVGAVAVAVSTTPLTVAATTADQSADVEKLARGMPVIVDRASRHVLVPGDGAQCLVEVRIGASLEDDATSVRFRAACVSKVLQIFGIGSAASFLLNCYEAAAVTLLNRRVDQTMRRGVIGASDMGRRVCIRGGVLEIDDVARPATWSIVPSDLSGMIEKAHADMDAAVTIRLVGTDRTVTISNPVPIHRARPKTLEHLYASTLRVALEHYRPSYSTPPASRRMIPGDDTGPTLASASTSSLAASRT